MSLASNACFKVAISYTTHPRAHTSDYNSQMKGLEYQMTIDCMYRQTDRQTDRLFYFSKSSMNTITSLKLKLSRVISADSAAHILQKVSSANLQVNFLSLFRITLALRLCIFIANCLLHLVKKSATFFRPSESRDPLASSFK